MAFYCGCATSENKTRWITFGVYLALGFVFMITLYVFATDNQDQCRLQGVHSCGDVEVLFWFAIMCWVMCSIPLYIMCCCATPPKTTSTISMPPPQEYITQQPSQAVVLELKKAQPFQQLQLAQYPQNYVGTSNYPTIS
eukprot:TRINITY_DN28_c2_g1_i2.p4 TRINITY_DN28_c2_g1~~TRINITY_DN28_c2_g1_i2.p4  ORF type:complete len:139 (-),score=3.60 TRINITY_DN28_c2_g1_i2:996-1412(-)